MSYESDQYFKNNKERLKESYRKYKIIHSDKIKEINLKSSEARRVGTLLKKINPTEYNKLLEQLLKNDMVKKEKKEEEKIKFEKKMIEKETEKQKQKQIIEEYFKNNPEKLEIDEYKGIAKKNNITI